MELFRQYLLERENVHLLNEEWGFATYSFGEDHVYLQDIYVVPEKRNTGLGVHLMNEVGKMAKERGCSLMLGSVDEKGNGSEDMKSIMKHLGFKEHTKLGSVVYYLREI
jgi:GNAT superfamily N-acetyltransferase